MLPSPMRDHDSGGGNHAERKSSDAAGPAPGPGKRTLVESVQFAAIPGGAVGDPSLIAAIPPSGGALLPDPGHGKAEQSFGADFPTAEIDKQRTPEGPMAPGRRMSTDSLPHAQKMEAAFGTSFEGVKARTGAQTEMRELGAHAVARGDEITFASAQPSEHLVAHELTHVIQQRRGGASAQAKAIEPGARDALEQEADAVADRVVAGGTAGEVRGATSGSGLRDGDATAKDVLPAPVLMTVLGDPFQLSFRRGDDRQLYCDVHYTGALVAQAPFMRDDHVIKLGAMLDDPARKLDAKITANTAGSLTIDVYGDGVTLATLTDSTSPGDGVRRHGWTWAVGRNGLGTSTMLTLTVSPDKVDGKGKGAGGSVMFKAVDTFTLDAHRYGDASAVAVTLRGSDIPNPQTFVVPVDGELTTVGAKVVSNDGHTIKIDLNGDGKADVTLVHTVEQQSHDGVHSQRIHHFRQFDKDGVVVGPRDGLQYANFGPPLAIPAAQDEGKAAALASKEAPATRPPQQGDVLGELPKALASPGDVIEMRVDGDGDRTKELVLRFKGIPGAEGDTKGQIRVDLIQLSSVGATGLAQSQTFDTTDDAVKSLQPWVTQVANGHAPMEVEVVSSVRSASGANLTMQLFPPTSDASNHRNYAVTLAGQTKHYTFPAETTPANPLVKSATAGQVANVSRFEVVLGEFGDRFWVMLEAQPGGKSVFSIAALNPDGPAGARGFPLVGGASTFAQVAGGATSFAIDVNNDGQPDLQLFDALSAPTMGGSPNAPLKAERDHHITISGPPIGGDQKVGFFVRNGKFLPSFGDDYDGKTADKQAAAGASATQILGEQADDSRSKNETDKVKDGDIAALMSRIAGALTANRLKARTAGLISDKLYGAWEQLSTQLITLGPQLGSTADKTKLDTKLQEAAATTAASFYAELAADTVGQVDVRASGGRGYYSSTSTNKFTGTVERTASTGHSVDGPGLRLPNEIRASKWSTVTADFDQLVSGLDKWIAAKQPDGSDAQKQQQYLTGMQDSMSEIKDKPGIVRVNATFQPDASYNTNTHQWTEIPLMLFTWKEGGKWWLKDISNPARDPFLDRVDANANDNHPPAEIFQQLDYARHFSKGVIHYQIPDGPGGQVVTTERKSWTDFAQWIGLGLAVVGFSLATFGTGTVAATAAAVAFAASGIAGAVYAGGDLYQRAQHGDLEPAAVVMDLAQIAAGVLTAGAAISGRIIIAAAKADELVVDGVKGAAAWSGAAARVADFAQKAYIPMVAGAAGADGINLMAMTADIAGQIAKIREGEGSSADKRAAIVALIAQGIALGGITIMSVKGSMPEIMSGRPTIVIQVENGIPVARVNRAAVEAPKPKPTTGGTTTTGGTGGHLDVQPNPAADDWIGHLRAQLAPDAQARLDLELKTKTPQQVMDGFHGDVGTATTTLSTPGGEKAPALKDTVDDFCIGQVPRSGPDRWSYIENPAHWTPARAKLHDGLIAKAKAQAQQFADAAQKGEPTLYAMRGNTAAGKTRAVSGGVEDLKGPMAATKELPHRSVNPDNFKADLIAATPGMTSTQVHSESSMLATRLERELTTMKTSDGKELGSILIDKRLAGLDDVQHYAQMAKDSGRKFVLYDVDAPLEVSLAGVLERVPGGADPLPPFDVVAGGFKAVRNNRDGVVKLFQSDPTLGTYELYATNAQGTRVKIATISGGNTAITDAELFAQVTAPVDQQAIMLGNTQITDQAIQNMTKDLPTDRQAKVSGILKKYEGWTWKSALDAHSLEKPPSQK
jgi:hypothetical protein